MLDNVKLSDVQIKACVPKFPLVEIDNEKVYVTMFFVSFSLFSQFLQMGHHKAASCSALPSFCTINPTSTSSKSSINNDRFLYPSFCLYSNRALANEYGSESDIVQFLSPETESLKERLPIFVGILQSLFTVANEMPFSHTCTEEDEEEINEVEDEEDCDSNLWSPFTIVGLDSMKLVVWPNMYDNILESTTEKDLCLVVIVSAQLQDSKIIHSMDLLKDSLNDTPCTVSCIQAYFLMSNNKCFVAHRKRTRRRTYTPCKLLV